MSGTSSAQQSSHLAEIPTATVPSPLDMCGHTTGRERLLQTSLNSFQEQTTKQKVSKIGMTPLVDDKLERRDQRNCVEGGSEVGSENLQLLLMNT